MSLRKTVFMLALVSASIPAAFASSGSTFVGGENSFETHAMPGSKNRADVQKELQAFRKNPVTADGGMLVGAELGYTFPQHSYAFQGGKLVHADSIAHNTLRPSLAMTDTERRMYRELYAN